jgi:hypothetical protein
MLRWLKAIFTWESRERKDLTWIKKQQREERERKKYAHSIRANVRREEKKRKQSLTGQ